MRQPAIMEIPVIDKSQQVHIFSVTLPALPWHSHCHTHSHVPTAPGPPQNLTLVNRTCHSITFQWSPPDDTGRLDVTGYDILHNGTPVANITGTVYTLEGLTPDTVHTVSVRTRNAIGPSALQKKMTAATRGRGTYFLHCHCTVLCTPATRYVHYT